MDAGSAGNVSNLYPASATTCRGHIRSRNNRKIDLWWVIIYLWQVTTNKFMGNTGKWWDELDYTGTIQTFN